MKDPHAELRTYLNELINRYLNIRSLYQELKSTREWETRAKIDDLNVGAHFFHLVSYSLSRIFLVELSMLLSDRKNRSLLDWLKKAREHAASVKPTRYNATHSEGEREPVKPEKYRAIIDCQIGQLCAREKVIRRIKTWRDKAIAHLDKDYFRDPEAFHAKCPLKEDDINELMDVVRGILRKHYSFLFEADINMEVRSVHGIDSVMRPARAFIRARRDRNLIGKGFKPVVYEQDDYRGESGATD